MRTFLSLIVAVSLMAFTASVQAQYSGTTFAEKYAEAQNDTEFTPADHNDIFPSTTTESEVTQYLDLLDGLDPAPGFLSYAQTRAAQAVTRINGDIQAGVDYFIARYPDLSTERKLTKVVYRGSLALQTWVPIEDYANYGVPVTSAHDPSHAMWSVGLQLSSSPAAYRTWLQGIEDANVKETLKTFARPWTPGNFQKGTTDGLITRAEVAETLNVVYSKLWTEYLMLDDQTTSEAQKLENTTTLVKSLRDLYKD